MLPRASIALINEEMMEKVRRLVKVDEFNLEWPDPFERFRYFSCTFLRYLLYKKIYLVTV